MRRCTPPRHPAVLDPPPHVPVHVVQAKRIRPKTSEALPLFVVSGPEAGAPGLLHVSADTRSTQCARNPAPSNRVSSISRSRKSSATSLGTSPRMTEPCHARYLECSSPSLLPREGLFLYSAHRAEVTRERPTGHRRVMDCPICLRDAKDATPPTYRGLVLKCPRCGMYRVTENAISALRSLKIDARLEAFRRAKVLFVCRTPTITSGCLHGATLSRKTRSRTRSTPTRLG